MKVNITSRHYKAARKIKTYVSEKIEKVTRFHDRIVGCEVILERRHNQEVAEIRLKVSGKTLNIKEASEDMTKSVDLAVDRLERQLKKHKEKIRDHDRQKVTDVIQPRFEKAGA